MVIPKAVTKDPERLINMLQENKVPTANIVIVKIYIIQLIGIDKKV
jgi:hypothetical protein